MTSTRQRRSIVGRHASHRGGIIGPTVWHALAVALVIVSGLFSTAAQAQSAVSSSIALSQAERAWLDRHPTIRMAIDNNWAPFEFADENGAYMGMAADYIRLVEERLGVKFDIDVERPWPEMVEAVKNRELDVFSLVVKTPQRESFVNFTKPYLTFPMVITTLRDGPFIDGLSVLRGKAVAVVRSYASHDLLIENHPELEIFAADSVKAALEAVSQGRADAFVGNLAVTEHVMATEGITNLKIAGQTPYRFELSMAVRSDWPELVPILQKALNSISAEEQATIFNRWLTIEFAEEIDYRAIIFIAVLAGLIVAVSIAWNRRLGSEIAKKNRALEALTSSEEKYRALFSTATVGMLLGRLDGTFVEVNDGFLDIIGYDWETLKTKTTWELTPQSFYDVQGDVFSNVTETGIYGPFEKEYTHRDGHTVPVMLHGALVKDEQGEPMIWTIVHDISEQRKIEEMKNAFISSVSHELRTPLTAIKGGLELVKGGVYGKLPDDLNEMVDISARNANRLLELVNDILEIESLITGQTEIHKEQISSVTDFLGACLEENASYGQSMDVAFRLQMPEKDLVVTADPARLKQVMSNLLSNAAKFSPAQSEIVVTAEQKARSVRVSVIDSGPGIPETFKGRIFGKFEQAHPGLNTGVKGSGLGLYISKSIIEMHGGRIGYEPATGGGTVFYFDLPVS